MPHSVPSQSSSATPAHVSSPTGVHTPPLELEPAAPPLDDEPLVVIEPPDEVSLDAVEPAPPEPAPPEVAEVAVGSPPAPAVPPGGVSLAPQPAASPSTRAEPRRRAVSAVSLRRCLAER